MFETPANELVSSLVLSSSSGPFDELAVLISWYELVNPMLNMLKVFKMACRNGMENTFITFHPLLRLRVEGGDHQATVRKSGARLRALEIGL